MFSYTVPNPETDYRRWMTIDSGAATAEAALVSIRRFVARHNRRLKAAGCRTIPVPKLDTIRREG